MKPVEPEELSALLDGELAAGRAQEVIRLIEADPALRQEYEALGKLDARLKESAHRSAFSPSVAFPGQHDRQFWPSLAVGLLLMMMLRIAAKLIDPLPLAFGLNAIGFILLLGFLLRLAGEPNVSTSLARMAKRA